jgi:hemoglobin-like flavoprotein
MFEATIETIFLPSRNPTDTCVIDIPIGGVVPDGLAPDIGMDRRMTPHQIALVQQSFAKVLPIRETAAALFYDRLFAIDPSTRPLFRRDMAAQGAKLMAAIATIVRSLDDLEPMVDRIQALARRHVQYGVTDAHYASVGAALRWTLEQGLGADFTAEVRDAWASAYDMLSSTMLEAASQPLAEAA